MENEVKEVVKNAVMVGNSAGVLVPRSWKGYKVRAVLIEEPIDIKKDIFKILENYLLNVKGIYISGSYARKEAEKDSDIDILAITSGVNNELHTGRYHIVLVDLKTIGKGDKDLFYILSLIKEAKSILNESLLKELQKIKLSKESLRWHIETSISSLKVIKKVIEINEIEQNRVIKNSIIYPLILRLREACIVECLIKNKNYSKKEFLNILNEQIGKKEGEELYKAYVEIRDKGNSRTTVDLEKIKKIVLLLEDIIKKQKKWLKEKKD